jgi:hypothetical protein
VSIFNEIQMRHGRRRTLEMEARRPSPYVLSDSESIKNAKKEPTERQNAFINETFLVGRDMQILLNAVHNAMSSWRRGDQYSEFEFFVTEAWDELPVDKETQEVMDRRLAEEAEEK